MQTANSRYKYVVPNFLKLLLAIPGPSVFQKDHQRPRILITSRFQGICVCIFADHMWRQ